MICSIRLENFKCFRSLRLDLAPFTLLTGFNAAGKSTCIQTLLLLAQTFRGQTRSSQLLLNGSLVSLGNPGDVINNASGGNQLALGLTTAGEVELLWRFAVPEENRRSLLVSSLAVSARATLVEQIADLDGLRPVRAKEEVKTAFLNLERLVYLSAARQVETEVFPIPYGSSEAMGDVGPIGQYAAWWLHQEGDTELRQERSCLRGERSTIRHEVNAWVGHLFPGVEVNAVPVPRTGLMRLELRSGPTSDWSRPANVGYGISYAFPVLVAGLCSGDGQPVIIDSPEAHLHPQGQSRIGRFLAQMAAAGGQIVVETHSDHFLNGVRIALRDGVIEPHDVAIYFFTSRPEAQVTRLVVDKNGSVSDWPEGFFDQSEKDLASLAGWS